MEASTCTNHASLQSAVVQDGFAFVHGNAMRGILSPFGALSDWPRFVESWNDFDLTPTWLTADVRRRRHAVYQQPPAAR